MFPTTLPPGESQTVPDRFTRRSCRECKLRHVRCEPLPGKRFGACAFCYDHGIDCYDSESVTQLRSGAIRAPNDGSIMLDGSTSAYGGFQLSNLSFMSKDDPDTPNLLYLRQDMQNRNLSADPEEDLDLTLKLDKPVEDYLQMLYYSRVHPYIPIVPRAYLSSIEPSQVLLAAMYGVASRLPDAIASTRDFHHIRRVLQNQLSLAITRYEPTLQCLQALVLIHLTLELQCTGLDGVEAWPLRLAQAVRMALDLRLHLASSYVGDSPLLQEVKRRTFWAIYTKDKWTNTGKGYPLMIYRSDITIPHPDARDLDNPNWQPHEFFAELIFQAEVLEQIISVCYRADWAESISSLKFQKVENAVLELGLRVSNPLLSDSTRSHLILNFVTIKLLFYSPFFRPSGPTQAALFSTFIPSLEALRIRLAEEAVSAILHHATVELLYSGPSIWSILFYANVRCSLVALSIKYDYVETYSADLRKNAELAINRVENLAKIMCQDKKWCFMAMSGNLVLWSKRIAEVKTADSSWKTKNAGPNARIHFPEYGISGDQAVDTERLYSRNPSVQQPRLPQRQPVSRKRSYSVQRMPSVQFQASTAQNVSFAEPQSVSLLPSASEPLVIAPVAESQEGNDSWAAFVAQNPGWGQTGDGWDLGDGFTEIFDDAEPIGPYVYADSKNDLGGGAWEDMFSGFV